MPGAAPAICSVTMIWLLVRLWITPCPNDTVTVTVVELMNWVELAGNSCPSSLISFAVNPDWKPVPVSVKVGVVPLFAVLGLIPVMVSAVPKA